MTIDEGISVGESWGGLYPKNDPKWRGDWINSLTKQEAINPIKKTVRMIKGFKNGSGILENKLKKGISGGSRLPKKNPIKLK